MPTAHALWVIVEGRSVLGGDQSLVELTLLPKIIVYGKPYRKSVGGIFAHLGEDDVLLRHT